jgi:hypothetical protein
MKRLALFVSAVMHPLFMPLVIIILAFHFDWYLAGRVSGEQEWMIYLIVLLSTVVFPSVNILLLKWYGVVSSLSMPIREERVIPFISTLLFFVMGYYLLRKGSLPTAVYSIYLGCAVALLLLIFINSKWKISVHSAAIGGVIGAFLALFQLHHFTNFFLLGILILCAGTSLTARLALNAHTPSQVYVGLLLGMITMFLIVALEVVI